MRVGFDDDVVEEDQVTCVDVDDDGAEDDWVACADEELAVVDERSCVDEFFDELLQPATNPAPKINTTYGLMWLA
jgi:hypothetical protein